MANKADRWIIFAVAMAPALVGIYLTVHAFDVYYLPNDTPSTFLLVAGIAFVVSIFLLVAAIIKAIEEHEK